MGLALRNGKVPAFVNQHLPKLTLTERKGVVLANLVYNDKLESSCKVDLARFLNPGEIDYHKEIIAILLGGGDAGEDQGTSEKGPETVQETSEDDPKDGHEDSETTAEPGSDAEALETKPAKTSKKTAKKTSKKK